MVKLISVDFQYCCGWSITEELADRYASNVLELIEKAGMLPPNTMPDSLQLTERNTEFLAKVNRHFKWEDINGTN